MQNNRYNFRYHNAYPTRVSTKLSGECPIAGDRTWTRQSLSWIL